jgi:hypothetical protein
MNSKCRKPECTAPLSCLEGIEDYTKCENWIANNPPEEIKKEKPQSKTKKNEISWSGKALEKEELSKISARNSPSVIGMVGKADVGKTTFLAMLYTLLINDKKLNGYCFSGSKTILGWDELHFKLKILKDKVYFPDPTPVGYLRFFHLALKNEEDKLNDLLISDASGEVFSHWSLNRQDERAENARWIYDNSSSFIFFIDCVDLIKRKNEAKSEILDIANQLTYNLKERPVIAVWSKSDKKNEVPKAIKESVTEEIRNIFPNSTQIDISNFSSQDPDQQVHINNLIVIEWLLDKMMIPSFKELDHEIKSTHDLFYNILRK